MGTALLSPEGEIQAVIAVAGDVAFNSHGDLSSRARSPPPSTWGMADHARAGQRGLRRRVRQRRPAPVEPRPHGAGVHVTSVAVDTKDAIVLVGYTAGTVDLFGEQFRAQYAQEPGGSPATSSPSSTPAAS